MHVLFRMDMKSVADATATKLTGNQTAPALKPVGDGVINVVKDFQWSASMREKYIVDETPALKLREYEVVGNALVQQAKYMAEFGVNFIGDGMTGKGVAMGIGGAAVGGLLGGKQGAMYGGVAGMMAAGRSTPSEMRNKGYLEAYKGLYNVKPTGFKYELPFFETDFRSVQSQWTDAKASESPIGSVINDIKGAMANVMADAAVTLNEPNAFIEEAKTYEHSRTGTQLPVRFELSNTGTYEDVVRNWHLVYMLLYQNMANRASKVLIRPPCLYEVELPGVLYHPFCNITNLSVKYKGAIRKMNIDIQTMQNAMATGERSVRSGSGVSDFAGAKESSMATVIPDAYEISLTIQPLVAETKNMAFHTTTKNSGIYSVKVSELGAPGQGPGDGSQPLTN